MNDHLIAMILEAMDYRSSRRTSQDSRNERHKNREMRQCSSKITICQNSTAENQWEEDNKKKPTVNRRRSKKLNLSSELWDFEGTNCKENGPPRGCFVRNVRNSERQKSEKVARVKRRRHSEKKGRDEKSRRREKKKRLSKSAHLTDPSFSPSAISLFSVGNVPFAPAKKRNRRLKKSDFYISTNEKENEADVESGFPLLTSPISESQLGSLNELFEVVDMADILGEQIEDAEILEAVEDLSFHAGYQNTPVAVPKDRLLGMFPSPLSYDDSFVQPVRQDPDGFVEIDDDFLDIINNDEFYNDPVSAFNDSFNSKKSPCPLERRGNSL